MNHDKSYLLLPLVSIFLRIGLKILPSAVMEPNSRDRLVFPNNEAVDQAADLSEVGGLGLNKTVMFLETP